MRYGSWYVLISGVLIMSCDCTGKIELRGGTPLLQLEILALVSFSSGQSMPTFEQRCDALILMTRIRPFTAESSRILLP